MMHEAQGFPTYAGDNAYDTEEEAFKKTVTVIPASSLPLDTNTISSEVIYKVKVLEDLSLKLKVRIAPYGNEYSIKVDLRSD